MKYVMASLLALGMFSLVGCEEGAFDRDPEVVPGQVPEDETRTERLPQDVNDADLQPRESRTPGESAATIDPPADTAPDTTPDTTEDLREPGDTDLDPVDENADANEGDAIEEVEVE